MNENELRKWAVEALKDSSDIAAITRVETLLPAGGRESIVFPPTYAGEESAGAKPPPVYVVFDRADGTRTVLIDSVPSQANRYERHFKNGTLGELVPKHTFKTKQGDLSIHDMPHRAADAACRASTMWPTLKAAFEAHRAGNAMPLGKCAPTSLLFGVWDSRGNTGLRATRILQSSIYAHDVDVVPRHITYQVPLDYGLEGFWDPGEVSKGDKRAEKGFANAINRGLGGVIAKGPIIRTTEFSLRAVRRLYGKDDSETATLRAYIFALGLAVATFKPEMDLRSGCNLVLDPEKPTEWQTLDDYGHRQAIELTSNAVGKLVSEAAKAFGVGPSGTWTLNKDVVREELGLAKKGDQPDPKKGKKS